MSNRAFPPAAESARPRGRMLGGTPSPSTSIFSLVPIRPSPAGPPYEVILEFSRAEEAADPWSFRFTPQSYLLRQEGGAIESAEFPWGQDVLDDLTALQQARPDRAVMQRLGDRLRAFLGKAGFGIHEERIQAAIEAERPVYLTIRSAAAELYALPWELVTLSATGQHLGEVFGCLFRYEWPSTRTAPPIPDPLPEGGRILFAWSAAGGAVPATDHLKVLRRACRVGNHPFDDSRCVLPHVSLKSLARALSAANTAGHTPVAVLHVLCHGGRIDSATESYGFIWNDSDGGSEPEVVDAGALRQVLAPHAGTLRLVVLCACHGGAGGALGNHLGSVAQALHRVGIPAVVASRYPLSTEGSVILANTLYQGLLLGPASLETSLLAARERLAERAGKFDWASLQLYARAADGAEHRPIVFRPYRGLQPFAPEDRRFFHGRRADVDRLLAALGKGQRLITLVGASGSGKSSLVMAGVIPALRVGVLHREYLVLWVRPGRAACEALASALTALSAAHAPAPAEPVPAEIIRRALLSRSNTLGETVERLLAGLPKDQGVLLVVDQFEDLFLPPENASRETTFLDDPEATAFIDNLLYATAMPHGCIQAILTLRADAMGRCLEHRGLAERIGPSLDVALPMSEESLRDAILKPAALAGIRFEEGLPDALLDGLREGTAGPNRPMGVSFEGGRAPFAAGKLPLLQFALDALWAHRAGDCIGWSAWRAIGGVRGAIAKRADEVLASCTKEEQVIVRHLFGRLVHLGKGAADTGRRARREELEAVAPKRVGKVLDRWIRARLLTTTDGAVGVIHEALIREWGTLQRWIDEDRAALALHQEVTHGAQSWNASGQSTDHLWRGSRLKQTLAIRDAGAVRLSSVEIAFLDAAEAEERRDVETVEAERARRIEVEEELSRARARARKTQRFGGAALAALLALSAAAGAALLAQRDGERRRVEATGPLSEAGRARDALVRAQDDAVRARDALRVYVARGLVERDPTTAVLLLRELERPKEAPVWIDLAREALRRPLSRKIVSIEGSVAVVDAAFSPDGARAVLVPEGDRVILASLAGKPEPITLQHDQAVLGASWSPDGTRVLTVSADQAVRLWPADGRGSRVVLRHEAPVRAASWSPNGGSVVTVSDDGHASVWSQDGTRIAILSRGAQPITAAAWSHDSKSLLLGAADGSLRIGLIAADAMDRRQAPIALEGRTDAVLTAAVSPGGERVLTVSRDGTARIASARGKGDSVVLRVEGIAIRAAVFSPDGRAVLTACADGTARLWPDSGRGKPLVFRGHREALVHASLSADGQWLRTASRDGTVRIWAADPAAASPPDETATGDPEKVLQRLRDATDACLSAKDRHELLNEPMDPAREAERACASGPR